MYNAISPNYGRFMQNSTRLDPGSITDSNAVSNPNIPYKNTIRSDYNIIRDYAIRTNMHVFSDRR